MVEFFLLLSALLTVAGLHSAYEMGVEEGERRAREVMRKQVFQASREEFARAEASRQELSGSYRMLRRLVSGLTKETP